MNVTENYRLLFNLFNACFKEPTPAKIGQELFTPGALKAPLRAQAAPAEKEPQYPNFQISLKTIFLDQKTILRKMVNNIFGFLIKNSSCKGFSIKFWWPAVMKLVIFIFQHIVYTKFSAYTK